ncbi:MAG: hypothetical protein RJB11_2020 [Planctomycetota bacterium]|jgi:hypothetical protein
MQGGCKSPTLDRKKLAEILPGASKSEIISGKTDALRLYSTMLRLDLLEVLLGKQQTPPKFPKSMEPSG